MTLSLLFVFMFIFMFILLLLLLLPRNQRSISYHSIIIIIIWNTVYSIITGHVLDPIDLLLDVGFVTNTINTLIDITIVVIIIVISIYHDLSFINKNDDDDFS